MTKKETIILTSTYNLGTGLLTAISVAFSAVFGFNSKALDKKRKRVVDHLVDDIKSQANNVGATIVSEVRFVFVKPLVASASAIAVKETIVKEIEKEDIIPEI